MCRILTGEEIPISPFSPLVQEVDDEGTERRQALSYPQLTKLVWTVLELVETLSHYRCCHRRLWELFVQFTIKHSRKNYVKLELFYGFPLLLRSLGNNTETKLRNFPFGKVVLILTLFEFKNFLKVWKRRRILFKVFKH